MFGARLEQLSTVFLAGNADILSAFESTHFQLKGTPSASEIELLLYLREIGEQAPTVKSSATSISVEPSYHGLSLPIRSTDAFPVYARLAEQHLGDIVERVAATVEHRFEEVTKRVESIAGRIEELRSVAPFDRFVGMDPKAFLEEMASHIDSPLWQAELQQSLLDVFVKHHPEYRLSRSIVVSGSSRTALGLLGFHCGIREVVVADLSWSYEHCFPTIHAVPLTKDFRLDSEAMIAAVQQQLAENQHWNEVGAVVLNNPHNATGRVFEEAGIRRLLTWLLDNDVFVIDDLSYQEVAPSTDLPRIKTVRQLADELVQQGRLSEEQTDRVITVHSVSKTDCLAGARLAIVELRHGEMFKRFADAQRHIRPNIGAIALTYLFYRNETEVARAFWRLRNQLFHERTHSLLEAVSSLPRNRNPFQIEIVPPTGSMYPLMVIHQLPSGLSLDWLASGLARQGIGILPLSTFARTEQGFETGRKTFRLTLGGTDGADVLLKKTRRVLIDLNRLIAEESSRYNRLSIVPKTRFDRAVSWDQLCGIRWKRVEDEVILACRRMNQQRYRQLADPESLRIFNEGYVPERLAVFRRRCQDRLLQAEEMMQMAQSDGGKTLLQRLERELYKDSLARRDAVFRERPSDRTVHPTQMYSIKAEGRFEEIIGSLLRNEAISVSMLEEAARELLEEFLALNVTITSGEEPEELVLDLDAIIAAENAAWSATGDAPSSVISFWGDWDGSNRPSGQGHRLVGATLIANVSRLARILSLLVRSEKSIKIDQAVLAEMRKLPESNRRFTRLLNDITDLTHQLEKRYRGVLPFNVRPGAARNIGMKLKTHRVIRSCFCGSITIVWSGRWSICVDGGERPSSITSPSTSSCENCSVLFSPCFRNTSRTGRSCWKHASTVIFCNAWSSRRGSTRGWSRRKIPLRLIQPSTISMRSTKSPPSMETPASYWPCR